jgi:hypothetical protein
MRGMKFISMLKSAMPICCIAPLVFVHIAAAEASSEPQAFLKFSGVFDVQGAPGPFSQPFAHAQVGDRYTFEVTFDPGAPDLSPADAHTGYYKAVTYHLLKIESNSSSVVGVLDGFDLVIRIDDDIDIGGTLYDRFSIRGHRNPGLPFTGSGSLFISQQMAFDSDTFTSDQLPAQLPPLSEVQAMGYQSGFLIFEVNGLNGFGFGLALLRGDIDDLIADADNDGLLDYADSCPVDPDNDEDMDGYCADIDNCRLVTNADQTDSDGDGVGDACDPCPYYSGDSDRDGDCYDNSLDNCPDVHNFDQLDTDGDSVGDACDDCPNDPQNDIDWDGLCSDADNCPLAPNPGQLDTDSDGLGDTCDLDDDGDSVTDTDEKMAGSDYLDPDTDDDGVGDAVDLCPGLIIDQAHYVAEPASLAGLVNSRVSHAQTFTVGLSGILDRVKLPLGRNEHFDLDSEVGDLSISITRTTNGLPNQDELGTAVIPAGSVPVSPGLFSSQLMVDVASLGIEAQAADLLAVSAHSSESKDSPLGPYFWLGESGDYTGQDGYGPGHRAFVNTDVSPDWQSDLKDDMGFQIYISDGFQPGEVVSHEGCSIAQLCPCQGDSKNKGAYISCVANATDDFLTDDLITGEEQDAIVSAAANSNCGSKK